MRTAWVTVALPSGAVRWRDRDLDRGRVELMVLPSRGAVSLVSGAEVVSVGCSSSSSLSSSSSSKSSPACKVMKMHVEYGRK